MKRFLRNRKRFALLSAAALIALSLSGCGLVFVPETESRASVSSSWQNDSSSSPVVSSGAAASSSVPEVPASSLPEIPASSELPEGSSSEEPSGFTVDYSRTPDCLRKAASDALIADAHSVVEACLSCQTSARVSCSREDAGLVLYLADTLCPLLSAFTNINEESWSEGAFSWEFYVDPAEFSRLRTEFEQQTANYIKPVLDRGYNETERALLLYHAYTTPAVYNFEIISGSFQTYTEAEQHRIHSAYAGIMDHTGVCHDLAGGMTFLFIQAGFNACRVSVIDESEEHSWTLLELGGRFTFCDATWDVGGSFAYFGNSAAERTSVSGGSFKLSEMNIYRLNAPSNFTIVNPGFKEVQALALASIGSYVELSIDSESSPHMLRFANSRTGKSVSIRCP